MELHYHEGRAVVWIAHVADGLIERSVIARGLGCPINGPVVLSSVISIVADVPDPVECMVSNYMVSDSSTGSDLIRFLLLKTMAFELYL